MRSSCESLTIAFHAAGPLAVPVVARTTRYCFCLAARIELARAKRRTYPRRAGLAAGAPLPPRSSLGTSAIRALDSTRTDLRVGIFQSVATAILPSILRELRAEMTDLEVRTTEAIDPLHLLDRVAQGELDLAFANPTHDGRLESCPLIEDPYIVLVAAGHPLAAARCVSATALAEWPLIAYRTVPDRLYPPAIEIDPEAVVYRTDDDAAIRAMVAYCQRINDSGD